MSYTSEYNNILEYLMSVTNYSKNSLLAKDPNILFNMYLSIKSCMQKYPLEILKLQEELKINKYTLEDLNKKSYNQLSFIKRQLKELKKKRNKNANNANNDNTVIEPNIEYKEPVLVSPDDLYISYDIDYNNYTDSQLLEMGFVVIDRDQDAYLSSVRKCLYEKLTYFLQKSNINLNYGRMNLEQLINFYVKYCSRKAGYKTVCDIEDEIKLEKRYKNE